MKFANIQPRSRSHLDVLIIDDDSATCETIKTFLRRRGLTAQAELNGFAGIHAVRRNQPRIVLLDIQMPGLDGLEVVQQVRKAAPGTRIVLMSGYACHLSNAGRQNLDVFAVLEKPLPLAAIADFARRAVESA